ncbi:MAG: hypothetical protein K9H25_11430 [Rhodospirillum sp.]|nr:hypothetical protein [Rhodospirillum sp.]MCF8489835.1 hypothetical protein [Rhodospirillum sp.]MCF8499670.1 hypothetical protein [Rhodospirillum sp.]
MLNSTNAPSPYAVRVLCEWIPRDGKEASDFGATSIVINGLLDACEKFVSAPLVGYYREGGGPNEAIQIDKDGDFSDDSGWSTNIREKHIRKGEYFSIETPYGEDVYRIVSVVVSAERVTS